MIALPRTLHAHVLAYGTKHRGATRAGGGSPVDSGAGSTRCNEMRNEMAPQRLRDSTGECRHRCGCYPATIGFDAVITGSGGLVAWAGVRGFCHVAFSLTSLSWNVEQDWIKPEGTSFLLLSGVGLEDDWRIMELYLEYQIVTQLQSCYVRNVRCDIAVKF